MAILAKRRSYRDKLNSSLALIHSRPARGQERRKLDSETMVRTIAGRDNSSRVNESIDEAI